MFDLARSRQFDTLTNRHWLGWLNLVVVIGDNAEVSATIMYRLGRSRTTF